LTLPKIENLDPIVPIARTEMFEPKDAMDKAESIPPILPFPENESDEPAFIKLRMDKQLPKLFISSIETAPIVLHWPNKLKLLPILQNILILKLLPNSTISRMDFLQPDVQPPSTLIEDPNCTTCLNDILDANHIPSTHDMRQSPLNKRPKILKFEPTLPIFLVLNERPECK
jgi:hypothetical protein